VSETERVVIENTKSGPIELVLVQGMCMTLQFNCSCTDALFYCKAICCRSRSGLNVILDQDEKDKFKHRLQNGLPVLQGKADDSCVYLSGDCKCTVHADKPRMCGAWHCSPGGKGEGIEVRDGGWFLSPFFGNQQQIG
jgi:hypothetical protein